MMTLDNIIKNPYIAIWRFGFIAKLINGNLSEEAVKELLNAIAQDSPSGEDSLFTVPDEEVIKQWLYRYNTGGLAALDDSEFDNNGKRTIPQIIAEKIRSLRQIHPRWTNPAILSELKNENLWDGRNPTKSELESFIQASNLQRTGSFSDTKIVFPAEYHGEIWHSDFMTCPKLYVGKEKKRVYLHAIVDEVTGDIIKTAFHCEQSPEVILAELKQAFIKHGLPKALSVDNAIAFRNRDLKIVCRRLNIAFMINILARPFLKRKIERFFAMVQNDFIHNQHFSTLEEIQTAFQKWLSDYTDFRKKILYPGSEKLKSVCRLIPEYIDIEPLFYFERRCRVNSNGTVKLKKHIYRLPVEFRSGKRVNIYFDANNPEKIFVGHNYIPIYRESKGCVAYE